MGDDRIPITRPVIEDDDVSAVTAVLRSGYLVQGEQVRAFEEELAEAVGAAHAVAVTSCTSALHVALLALGIGPGDLVLVAPYSWMATANVVELCGATPVFSDIDPRTLNLSAEQVQQTVDRLAQDGRLGRLKAILPVHTFGNPAGFEAIHEQAQALGVPVIEDAACALGARIGERAAGTVGDVGCYSFHPRKIITTGEGGMLVTDDARLADFARAYRNHGQVMSSSGVTVPRPGDNLRMTDLQAAMGRTQLRKLARLCADRERIAARYDNALPSLGFQVQERSAGAVVQSYVALAPAGHRATELIESLRAASIDATVGTNAIPFLDFYATRYGVTTADLPVLADVAERAVTLPLFPSMDVHDVDRVVEVLGDLVR